MEEFLSLAGYSETQVARGLAWADAIGWDDQDQRGQLALSRILLSDAQLAAGELVGWEPGCLLTMEDEVS